MVVGSGDSLWSISVRRLGPDATPRRILNGVERIYALNRDRIGPDPDLIFVGQELLVPPALTERSAETRPKETPSAHKTTGSVSEAAGAGPRDRAAKRTTGGGQSAAPSRSEAKSVEASDTVTEQGTHAKVLPEEPAAALVPAVGAVASKDAQPSPIASLLRTVRAEVASAVASAAREGSRLLGLGVLALTLVAAALMAWKLPMRRTIRQDAERLGTLAGYFGYYGETPSASRITPFAHHPGALEEGDGRDAREREPQAPEALTETISSKPEKYNLWPKTGEEASLDNHVTPNGDASAASMIRKAAVGRGRARTTMKSGAMARNGLALGAHNPKIRSAPLRALALMRAQTPSSERPSRRPVALGQTK